MAVVPRAAATTPIVPISPWAYSGGAISAADTAKPIDPVNERTALNNEQESLQFELFKPDFEESSRRATERRKPRRNLSSLFSLSSEGFANAFSIGDKGNTLRGGSRSVSSLTLRKGLEIYQTNLEVTGSEQARRGDMLSMRM
ncbi:MAG: hypothetical protein O3A84_08090 [Proteobacteria bacterium]|nr:hypothetical protein [Pseudomonadota bacterium]